MCRLPEILFIVGGLALEVLREGPGSEGVRDLHVVLARQRHHHLDLAVFVRRSLMEGEAGGRIQYRDVETGSRCIPEKVGSRKSAADEAAAAR